MNTNKKLAFTGVVSNLLGVPGKKILSFLITIVIINNYTVREYGQFNLYLGFLGLTVGISLGIDKVIQRYFPNHIKQNKSAAIKSLLVLFTLRIISFFILLFIIFILANFNIVDIDKFKFPYFSLAIITAIAQVCSNFFLLALNSAFLEHKFFNSVYIATSAIKLLLIYNYRNSELIVLLLIWTFIEILITILFFVRLLQRIELTKKDISNFYKQKLPYKRYFDFGKYTIFATIGTQLISAKIAYYFLSYYQNNEYVGLYSFAVNIVTTLALFAPSNMMFNITIPLLIKKIDNKENLYYVAKSMGVFLKLNIFAWSILILFTSFNLEFLIIKIFKEDYLKAIPFINWWFIFLFSHIIKNVFEPIARAMENTKVYLFTLYASIINIIGCYFLIPKYSINGALIAAGVSLFVQSLGISYYTNKKINIPIEYKFFAKLIPNLLIIGSLLHISSKMINNNILLFFIFNIVVISLSFLLLYFNKCFSNEDREYINSFLPKNIFVF